MKRFKRHMKRFKRILPLLALMVSACNVPTGQTRDSDILLWICKGLGIAIGAILAFIALGIFLIALVKRIWTGSW